MCFFRLMARRYEHMSTILTGSESFSAWGEVGGDRTTG
jgi:hypothetical protein